MQGPTKARWVIACLACLAAVAVVWMLRYGVDTSIDTSSGERLAIWRDTIANLTIFGHGLGSFREVFLQTASSYDFNHWQSWPEHPHNEWLWLAFEGGVPALGMGIAFALSLWHGVGDMSERGILACVFVLSLFAMPFHDPATLVLGALCAGFVVGCDARVRDKAVHRRIPLRAGLAADTARRRAF